MHVAFAMHLFEDADDFISKLPPLSEDDYAKRLADTFSITIEGLDTSTLDYLRVMLVERYSSDPHYADMLDLLDGERMLRTSDRG